MEHKAETNAVGKETRSWMPRSAGGAGREARRAGRM